MVPSIIKWSFNFRNKTQFCFKTFCMTNVILGLGLSQLSQGGVSMGGFSQLSSHQGSTLSSALPIGSSMGTNGSTVYQAHYGLNTLGEYTHFNIQYEPCEVCKLLIQLHLVPTHYECNSLSEVALLTSYSGTKHLQLVR